MAEARGRVRPVGHVRGDPVAAPAGSTWNGEPYRIIARNIRPDHLAILTDELGACSVVKGRGVNNPVAA